MIRTPTYSHHLSLFRLDGVKIAVVACQSSLKSMKTCTPRVNGGSGPSLEFQNGPVCVPQRAVQKVREGPPSPS